MSHPTETYSGIASGHTDAPSTPPILNSSFPNKCAYSATDFINYIFAFEKRNILLLLSSMLYKKHRRLSKLHTRMLPAVPDSVGAFTNALISKLDIWRYLCYAIQTQILINFL